MNLIQVISTPYQIIAFHFDIKSCPVQHYTYNGTDIYPVWDTYKISEAQLQFALLHVYAWSFIHCLFIYARTHVRKKRQWKSTFTVIVDRYPRCMCTDVLSDTTFRPVECTIQHFQTDQVCSFLLLLRSTSIISR